MNHLNRTIAQFLLTAVGIYLISLLTPDLHFSNFLSAMIFTLISAFLTSVLWPLIVRRMERFLVTTFGLGSFLISASILWLESLLIPGVTISGWGWITVPVVMAVVSTVVTTILNIDDDDLYASTVYSYMKNKTKKTEAKDQNREPGFIFLEIDGLSETVLKAAMEKGRMPFLSDLVKKGAYKIKPWETDLSSQTGASQAGILHGCNKDIPAFRWVEKSDNNKIVASNGIGDAPKIQERISNGNGLLSDNGGAIANLFTGDSKDNIFVYSVITNIRQLYSESWTAFYTRPFNLARVLVLCLAEIFLEMRSRYRQWKQNIQPRLQHRGLTYYVARAGANVFLREISTYIVIGDIIVGDKNAVYTTYFGYDEVAHHCGVADDESFYTLEKLDHRISRIFAARKYGKRPYDICILSDHGQTNGATFKQRYGLSLDKLVKTFLPEQENIYHELDSNQDHYSQMITAPSETVKRKFNRGSKEKKQKSAGVIVLASGNLGLIYFTKWQQRLTLEEINNAYPQMISGLTNHKGVGFVMVRSKEHGSVVISAEGKYFLTEDRTEGENPLSRFGEHAAVHLRRTDSFRFVPDILVMSLYDPQLDQVAAFEELIGSHGGLGGDQSKPFIMYPAEWSLDDQAIVGAEKIYQLFKKEVAKASVKA